jgi:hypothetical protein
MTMRAAAIIACRLALLPGAVTVAHAAAPAVASFAEPEVLKLGWNTRAPRSADFNGDGRPDLALINQDRARIEFLLQGADGAKPGKPETTSRRDVWNPLLEVSRFEKQPLVVPGNLYSLAVGDFNGDGRADIAYTTEEKRLVLRLHGKTMSDWTQKREFMLDSVSNDGDAVLAVDLNADKRTDLVVLTETRLLVLLQPMEGEWGSPREYALTDPGCTGVQAADLDKDGRVDLVTTSASGDAALVRLQAADGSFSKEWRLNVQAAQSWIKPVKQADGVALAWLQKDTGMMETARLRNSDTADTTRPVSLRQSIPPSDSKTGSSVHGDLTGDGIADIVIAEPKRARVWVFAGRADGSFDEGKEYPSLSGIESMSIADVNGDKKPELVVLSPLEKSIAVAHWEGSRLSYPETIYQSDEALVALTTGTPGPAAGGAAIVCVKDGKPKASLLTLRWNAKDKAYASQSTDLPKPPSKISAVRVLDADQDGQGDIVLFSSLAPLQILLTRANAKEPLLKVEGLPDSLISKLAPVSLTQADITGDGKPELIAAHDQLARAFNVDAQGKAHIVEQFNAQEGNAQLVTVLVPPTAKNQPKTVLLVDAAAHKLHDLKAGTDGVYRSSQTRMLSDLMADEIKLVKRGTETALLLLGRQSFEIVPLSGARPTLERSATFASELRDAHADDFVAAPFTGRGTDDLMLIDTQRSRVLEFFRSADGDTHDWQSFLYFRVFQSDPHYRGKTGFENEPHDYAAMDINGDGKADLCLLVHDRLLLYVQR